MRGNSSCCQNPGSTHHLRLPAKRKPNLQDEEHENHNVRALVKTHCSWGTGQKNKARIILPLREGQKHMRRS